MALARSVVQRGEQTPEEKWPDAARRQYCDASIISAPSSTKDEIAGATRKGNQWYFAMKMYIGVNDTSGLIQSIDAAPTNVYNIVPAGNLLYDD